VRKIERKGDTKAERENGEGEREGGESMRERESERKREGK